MIDLSKLKLPPRSTLLKGKVEPSATTTKPRKRRFLPGESRATVGVDGFKPMDVEAYIRRLYANSEPRNLTPPQYLNKTLKREEQIVSERRHKDPSKNREWTFLGSDPHFPTLWKKERRRLHHECCTERYCEKFLLRVMNAEYRHWRFGTWLWREIDMNISPTKLTVRTVARSQ